MSLRVVRAELDRELWKRPREGAYALFDEDVVLELLKLISVDNDLLRSVRNGSYWLEISHNVVLNRLGAKFGRVHCTQCHDALFKT